MKTITVLLFMLFSSMAHTENLRIDKEQCSLIFKSVDSNEVDARLIKADFAALAVAAFYVPNEYWPPQEGKVYRWKALECSHCKMWMQYKDGVLGIHRNRQIFTHESEYLKIETDLDFQNVGKLSLREGLRSIPLRKVHCFE